MGWLSKLKDSIKSFVDTSSGQTDEASTAAQTAEDKTESLADSADTVKSTSSLYDEAENIASGQATQKGQIAGAEALATSKMAGGGKLGNAVRATQAATDASRNAYTDSVNDISKTAQEQNAQETSATQTDNQLKANSYANTAATTATQAQNNANNKKDYYNSIFSNVKSLFS